MKRSPIKRKPTRTRTPIQQLRDSKNGGPLVGKKPQKPMRKVSKKRRVQLATYSQLRKRYLSENPICQVFLKENRWLLQRALISGGFMILYTRKTIFPIIGTAYNRIDIETVTPEQLHHVHRAPWSEEIHHVGKRRGELLNDSTKFLAVCRANHERIENDKVWARAMGYLENF